MATPASLELKLKLVPWPGESVGSPMPKPPAVGRVVSGPPAPPGPAGSGCGSIGTTRIASSPLPVQTAKPVPVGAASTIGLDEGLTVREVRRRR